MDLVDLEQAIATVTDPSPPIALGAPLRASQAGMCGRKIGYELRGETITNFPAHNSIIAFAVGHSVHLLVQRALQQLYPLGHAELECGLIVEDGKVKPGMDVPLIGCHADYAYGLTIVEIKTMHPYAYARASQDGVQEHHLLQAGLAGLATEALRLELVYIDKSSGAITLYGYGEDYWRDKAEAEALRLARIYQAHLRGELAAKLDEAHQHWQCKYCPFLAACSAKPAAVDPEAPF